MSGLTSPSDDSTFFHSELSSSEIDEVSTPEASNDGLPVMSSNTASTARLPIGVVPAVGLLGSAESLRRKIMLGIIDKLHHLGWGFEKIPSSQFTNQRF